MTDYMALLKALVENAGGKQTPVAERIGVNQSSISRWMNGGKIDADNREKIKQLASEVGLYSPMESAVPPDLNSIPEIDVIGGLGGGGIASAEVTSKNGITFSKDVVRDHWRIPDWALARMGVKASHVAAFPVRGDSMEPTIDDGDIAFFDTRHRVPSPPGIYALADEFGGVVVKRLEVISRPGEELIQIQISSDNERHATRQLTLDEIAIIGRFIGRFTT